MVVYCKSWRAFLSCAVCARGEGSREGSRGQARSQDFTFIGVARGAVGAPAPPERRKKWLGVIYRENL